MTYFLFSSRPIACIQLMHHVFFSPLLLSYSFYYSELMERCKKTRLYTYSRTRIVYFTSILLIFEELDTESGNSETVQLILIIVCNFLRLCNFTSVSCACVILTWAAGSRRVCSSIEQWTADAETWGDITASMSGVSSKSDFVSFRFMLGEEKC